MTEETPMDDMKPVDDAFAASDVMHDDWHTDPESEITIHWRDAQYIWIKNNGDGRSLGYDMNAKRVDIYDESDALVHQDVDDVALYSSVVALLVDKMFIKPEDAAEPATCEDA